MRAPLVERLESCDDGVERLWVSVGYGGRAWYWAVVHHVDGVLVDSGPSHARRAVERFVRARPLATVLTTHLHEDHVGNHEVLPRDVPVWAPAATVALLEEGPPRIPLYRRITWGTHGAAPGARVLGKRLATPKRTFRVIDTPGHSADHVSFLDEAASAMFTGDAYLGKPRVARLEEDIHTEIASMRRLADVDAGVLYSGHTPTLRRPREKLLDAVEYFESLARRCWALHDKAWPVRRIRRELLGGEPAITRFSLGEFSADNLVVNLLRQRV